MEVKTVFCMDHYEFEALVKEKTGVRLEYCAITESGSGTDHFYENIEDGPNPNRYKSDTPLDKIVGWYMGEIEEIDEWIAGENEYIGISQLLTWLAYRGHINPGNYLISINY